MAQDSRNQLQSQRVRVLAWRWRQLCQRLGVSEAFLERPDVRESMDAIEKVSFDLNINREW